MLDKIKEYLSQVKSFKASTTEDLENFRIKYLGKKGVLNDLFEDFKKAPNESKREIGQLLNQLKNEASERVNTLREQFEAAKEQSAQREDLSRPALTNLSVRAIRFRKCAARWWIYSPVSGSPSRTAPK